jgi:hypothetical protein
MTYCKKGTYGEVGQINDQNKPKNNMSCTKVAVGRWVKLTTRTSQRTISHVQRWLWVKLTIRTSQRTLTHLPTATFVHDLLFFGLFWSLIWPTTTFVHDLLFFGLFWSLIWPTTTFVHDLLFFGLFWSLICKPKNNKSCTKVAVGRRVKLTIRTSQRTICHVQRWLWEGGSN